MKQDIIDRLWRPTPARCRWPKSGVPYWATLFWVALIVYGFVGGACHA